jgi:hypothetical protein
MRQTSLDRARPRLVDSVTALRNGDAEAGLAAADEALKLDARSLPALLLKGECLERLGRPRRAAEAYGAALRFAPAYERVAVELQPMLRRAQEVSQRVAHEREAFLRAHMAEACGLHATHDLERFGEALEVVVGRKAIYRQMPLLLFWPRLPAIQFYPRRQFPFLDAIEARFEAIRAELLDVLRDEDGVVPYIDIPDGSPTAQWSGLNRSPAWSAYHLIKDGLRDAAHFARCPATAAAVELACGPRIPGQNPTAMFSILRPRTRIPPHTGATNARLVVHLPLIVPERCGFRVGNETRAWVSGKAWVFDDTIEHEAWNDSDAPRAILIFDIWNPHLSAAERALIPVLVEGMIAFRESEGPLASPAALPARPDASPHPAIGL